jgi:hypothetical protein
MARGGCVAAVAPRDAGRDFNLYSSTSSGSSYWLDWVLQDLHPTDADGDQVRRYHRYNVLDGNTSIRKSSVKAQAMFNQFCADPGLVYDNGFLDWLAFCRYDRR